MSLISWYYWRKFQKLKDELVETYNIRNQRGRYEQSHQERYMKQQNKLDFKFFRG